jgi:hypothetical protein
MSSWLSRQAPQPALLGGLVEGTEAPRSSTACADESAHGPIPRRLESGQAAVFARDGFRHLLV